MLIKKIFFVLFSAFLIAFSSIYAFGAEISASSAIVINAETKEIIYRKNAFEKRSMASTTKMMTSILAIESGRLDDKVTVTKAALTEGSSIGLKEGYMLTLCDLVYGMMLESGNDAANLCALHLGGDFGSFSEMMNNKAEEIGMSDTNFVTPSGLDADEHYSTAYDMALLGAYCIRNPLFCEICSEKRKTVRFISPEISVNFSNHNRLLESCEGVFGIKTGFTRKSGRCLVTACERDGAVLVCVTLNAGDDWNDHRKLYDMSFSELNKSTVGFSGFSKVAVFGSDVGEIDVYCDDFAYYFKEADSLEAKVIIPPIIYAPIAKGDIIGRVNYFSGDTLVHTSYIYSKQDVFSSEETFRKKASLIDYLKGLFFRRKE